MGAIKDLVDLVTQLNEAVEDRKFANELRQVQSMIGTIQSEHAEIHEQRINLLSENAELKQEIASLKEEIQILKQQALEASSTTSSAETTLSQQEVDILLYLSKVQEATEGEIAHTIGYNLTKTQFWLTRLIDIDMINRSLSLVEDSHYYLQQGGREYLVGHDLI
jgi:uncharacterized small protein (DUF1192 family)